MTLPDLAKQVSEEVGLDRVVTEKVLRTFIDLTMYNIIEGNEINIPEFGKWKITSRPERMCYFPREGEYRLSPKVYYPSFRVSSGFKREFKKRNKDYEK